MSDTKTPATNNVAPTLPGDNFGEAVAPLAVEQPVSDLEVVIPVVSSKPAPKKTVPKTTDKKTEVKKPADEKKSEDKKTPNGKKTFSDFGLNKFLVKALDDKGYTVPTEIQEKTLEAFGSGKHIVGQSQTGTGKTAAFCLPALNAIDTRLRAPQVLILAPTRELASQIRDEVFELSKHMYMRSEVVTGGSSKRRQINMLEKGPQVVIGTVGRVKDLIDMGKLRLNDVKYFILDEVDRMLDMGFIEDIEYIWSRSINIDQVLSFSATMPRELKSLLEHYIGKDYEQISVAPQKVVAAKVDHMFIDAPTFKKFEMLKHILDTHPDQKAIIFAETKRGVDELAYMLNKDGHEALALHGDMEQRDRYKTLKAIKNPDHPVKILVATDVAARGLNMKNVDIVINFEVPRDPESYVHRIGRTGRAGAEGKAIMLVSNDEYKSLHAVERKNKITIKKVDHDRNELPRTDKPQRGGGRGQSKYNRGGYNRGSRSSGGYNRGRNSSSSGNSRYGNSRSGSRSGSSYGSRDSGGYSRGKSNRANQGANTRYASSRPQRSSHNR